MTHNVPEGALKLDGILYSFASGLNQQVMSEKDLLEHSTQQIKDLILELVSEVKKYPGQYDVEYRNGRHAALGQLCKKVKQI